MDQYNSSDLHNLLSKFTILAPADSELAMFSVRLTLLHRNVKRSKVKHNNHTCNIKGL